MRADDAAPRACLLLHLDVDRVFLSVRMASLGIDTLAPRRRLGARRRLDRNPDEFDVLERIHFLAAQEILDDDFIILNPD